MIWNLSGPLGFKTFNLLKCHHVYTDHIIRLFLFQKASGSPESLAACGHRDADTDRVMSSLLKTTDVPRKPVTFTRSQPHTVQVIISVEAISEVVRLAKCTVFRRAANQ